MFKLLNKEFTVDVDVSKLPCGLNGALYFSEMMADGGMSEYAGNHAGAKYGTGYCDAQCPHDVKFINGEANTLEWNSTSAKGKWGSCCAEMDIWEANSQATAVTPHPCSLDGPKRCENADDCGSSGFCDKPGCDLNPYRFGAKAFFGEGSSFGVDTSKPFTVVTQFITSDQTDTGDLVEIRRKYIQNGKLIESPKLNISGKAYDSISSDFCVAQKEESGDKDQFTLRGGMKQMGKALERGMVLVLSIWDDVQAHMLWLDSKYPIDASGPATERGPCATSTGEPSATRAKYPDSSVKYMNIKVGDIGTTTKGLEERLVVV
jgi:cellulose 1,4-beta-cellobiosidase